MAKKTTTLFEKWKSKRSEEQKETEEKFLNPLDVRLDGEGDIVRLNTVDWDDMNFSVNSFSVVTRTIGGKEFPFTDYDLHFKTLEGEEIDYILRYIPLERPDGDLKHQVFLLQKADEFGHDAEVVKVLDANQGFTHFVSTDDENQWQGDVFPTRVSDAIDPYRCTVDTIRDVDGDGDVHDHEVETYDTTYWDFWRNSEDPETGEKQVEYLFVEIDSSDGWTTILRGHEIDPAIIVKV